MLPCAGDRVRCWTVNALSSWGRDDLGVVARGMTLASRAPDSYSAMEKHLMSLL